MQTKTVVIIGGGFAGAQLAKQLERKLPEEWVIRLLSRDNFITYNPLLPEVVGASLLPGHVVAPLRQITKRTIVSMVQVTDVDLESRTVHYLGEGPGIVHYDHLVIACGQGVNLGIIKGMARYALPLKTLGDSLFLRNRAIVRLEQAELQPDEELRRWLTTFVVIGGGFSGVEVAGELADFLRASRRFYRSIDSVRVQLIHSGDRLLPELSASLGQFAQRKMMERGIDVRLNARASRVDARCVYLADGDAIAAGTIICTIGIAPNPLVEMLPIPKNRGRIEVGGDMRVVGMSEVWALGDCAAVPNAADAKLSPPTA
ncbi:MAG TPA: FAD-dependent oxidoreductase, partial [Gammaproteobacteria bacterium]|nr:FAD-dependent oxidoreductase [Gammaproteobacteria bacterium]